MQKTQVQSVNQEDHLEKEMVTHSVTLAWEIPWTEKPGRLQSMESQKSWTRLSNSTTQILLEPALFCTCISSLQIYSLSYYFILPARADFHCLQLSPLIETGVIGLTGFISPNKRFLNDFLGFLNYLCLSLLMKSKQEILLGLMLNTALCHPSITFTHHLSRQIYFKFYLVQ